MFGLGLLTAGLAFIDYKANSYRVYATFSGLMMGIAIGLAIENVPAAAVPLGVLSLGVLGIGAAIEDNFPK